MTDDPKLQMARRAAASAYQNAHDYDYALWVMHGLKDDTIGVKIALAAIEECTEAAPERKLLELVSGYADYQPISEDRWEQGKAAGYRELGQLVRAAINVGDHLKGPTDPIVAAIADDIANGRTESQQP